MLADRQGGPPGRGPARQRGTSRQARPEPTEHTKTKQPLPPALPSLIVLPKSFPARLENKLEENTNSPSHTKKMKFKKLATIFLSHTIFISQLSKITNQLPQVRASLKELQKGIKGEVVISEAQEEIFLAIFEGRVAAAWMSGYPSLKPLGSWMPDLVERIKMFFDWAEEEMPMIIWLCGFTYPTGFLTGKEEIAISL
jgi:hypothetical protein